MSPQRLAQRRGGLLTDRIYAVFTSPPSIR
jgi:hypothetical protein